MTKLEALKALAEKVEAGALDWNYCGVQHVHGIGMNETMWVAYQGSLDAAKALHEAVLPGWAWSVDDDGEASVGNGPQCAYLKDKPASAWLIAILKALIAQEEANGLG